MDTELEGLRKLGVKLEKNVVIGKSLTIQDLKNVVLELQQRSEVEWIAFDHDLVSTSFEGGKIEDLKGEGGTSYVPAIKKAVEYLQNNYADKIILISDGEPSEGLDAILQAAKELNQPLNTITISNFLDGYENGTVAIMKDIVSVWKPGQYMNLNFIQGGSGVSGQCPSLVKVPRRGAGRAGALRPLRPGK